jgi:hypothetical protein
MIRRRIHTRTIIDLIQDRILEDEWYWYDGLVALAGMASIDQDSYAFYDDGTESGSNQIGSTNTQTTLDVDTNYQCRLLLQEDGGGSGGVSNEDWEYNHNSGGWTTVTTTSSVIIAVDSANLTDGNDTTQRIGSGTFDTTNAGISETGAVTNNSIAANNEAENLLSFQIVGADVSDGDEILLRISGLNTYTRDADIDVNKVAVAIDRSASDTVSVADATTIELDYNRALTDTVIVADQTERSVIYNRKVSDSILASDATTIKIDYGRDLFDVILISDQITVELQINELLSDSINVTDIIERRVQYRRQAQDSIVVVDDTTIENIRVFDRSVSDTISIADQITAGLEIDRLISDVMVLSDVGTLEKQSVDTAEVEAQEEVEIESATSGNVPIPVAGTNRLLIVIISKDSNVDTTNVTYDATPLAFAASASDGTRSVELWRLLNPATGTNKEVEATFASAVDAMVEVVNYSGFNQYISIDDFKFEIIRRWRALPVDPWTEISFSFNDRKSVAFASEMSFGISGLSERIARWVNTNDIIPIDSITTLDEVSVEKL